MKKLTSRQENQLFSYLLKANTLLNTVIEDSEDGEVGMSSAALEDISNLADAFKEKMDNTNWV